jgi:hypothetical protein
VYKLIIMLCLTGTPCIKVEHTKQIHAKKDFIEVENCKKYADDFFIDEVQNQYSLKWDIYGALCIREDLIKEKENI